MAILAPTLASSILGLINPPVASKAACMRACISLLVFSTTPELRAAPTTARVTFWGRLPASPPTSVATAFQPAPKTLSRILLSSASSVVAARISATLPIWLLSFIAKCTCISSTGTDSRLSLTSSRSCRLKSCLCDENSISFSSRSITSSPKFSLFFQNIVSPPK